MATKDTILLILQAGPRTTDQLIAALSKSYAAVHTSLRRLSRVGKVVENANGSWSLPGQQTAAPAPVAPPLPSTATGTYAQAQAYATPTAQAKKLRTKAILVVDDSGSVNNYARTMNDSINKTISDLKAESYRTGVAVDLSVYYFKNYRVYRSFYSVDIRDCKAEPMHYPDGGTPLFNAVEDAIRDHLAPERADEEVAYLLLIITDGDDNQSRDPSGNTMKDLIRRVQGTDRWTITFQMPPHTSGAFCRKYGIHPGNTTEWELSDRGLRETTVLRTASVNNYMTSRTKGVTSMSTFYTDLSNIDVNDLKRNLANIQDKVKTFPVAAEADIRPFIEGKTGTAYEAGSVFYQLTKPETIQDTKKLLIKEKNGRAMYAGNEARTVLGLPVGQDCRVKPGNHANFDLFVQSTSVNRKLVRGTTVVHWPLALQ